jgi:hypothetical protein
MSSPKDKEELVLNPVTGKLDVVRKFNADRIVTSELGPNGNPLYMFDPITSTYFQAGPFVVCDNNGNVVVI